VRARFVLVGAVALILAFVARWSARSDLSPTADSTPTEPTPLTRWSATAPGWASAPGRVDPVETVVVNAAEPLRVGPMCAMDGLEFDDDVDLQSVPLPDDDLTHRLRQAEPGEAALASAIEAAEAAHLLDAPWEGLDPWDAWRRLHLERARATEQELECLLDTLGNAGLASLAAPDVHACTERDALAARASALWQLHPTHEVGRLAALAALDDAQPRDLDAVVAATGLATALLRAHPDADTRIRVARALRDLEPVHAIEPEVHELLFDLGPDARAHLGAIAPYVAHALSRRGDPRAADWARVADDCRRRACASDNRGDLVHEGQSWTPSERCAALQAEATRLRGLGLLPIRDWRDALVVAATRCAERGATGVVTATATPDGWVVDDPAPHWACVEQARVQPSPPPGYLVRLDVRAPRPTPRRRASRGGSSRRARGRRGG
jgi:hypothetical protein